VAIVFAMPGNEGLADELAALTASGTGTIECRRFPDGESYVRVRGEVRNEDVLLVCTLARPDEKFLSLAFAARALRSAGAASIILVAPYLAYLRQDRRFNAGEAVSSLIFADLIGREVDRLITVDPHLHRYASLREVYSIPAVAVHASGLIGTWVRDHVASPVVLGPDEESAQWVEEIAREACCPWAVFRKERHGDRDVRLTAPALGQYLKRTPVVVDDIVSSGSTMIEAAKMIAAAGLQPPHCVAVHALFTPETAAELHGLTESLVTTDSVPNKYGQLKVAPLIAERLTTVSA